MKNLLIHILSIPITEIRNQRQYTYADNGTDKPTKEKLEIISKRVELNKETIKLFEKSHTQNHCANQYEIVGVPSLLLYCEMSKVFVTFNPYV